MTFVLDNTSKKLRSVAEIEELSPIAFNSYRRKIRMATWVYGFTSIGLMYPATLGIAIVPASVIGCIFLLGLLCQLDREIIDTAPNQLIARSHYYRRQLTSKRSTRNTILFIAAMTLLGTTQMAASIIWHQDQIISGAGVIFNQISNGEYWRLLTGPLIHGSFMHWAANLTTGTLIIILTNNSLGTYWWIPIIMGNTIVSTVSYIALPQYSTGFIGISGGLLFTIGYFLGLNLTKPKSTQHQHLPKGLILQMSSMGAIMIALSSTLTDNSANLPHLLGFCMGILFGLIPQPSLTRRL